MSAAVSFVGRRFHEDYQQESDNHEEDGYVDCADPQMEALISSD